MSKMNKKVTESVKKMFKLDFFMNSWLVRFRVLSLHMALVSGFRGDGTTPYFRESLLGSCKVDFV